MGPPGTLSGGVAGYDAVWTGSSTLGNGVLYDNGNLGVGTTTPAVTLDLSAATDSIRLPAGTTAQRPGTPVNGDLRYNTSNSQLEAYVAGAWISIGAGSFGTWSSPLQYNTVYQAATDGFVTFDFTPVVTEDERFTGYTNSTNPPNVERFQLESGEGGHSLSAMMPVRKGDYWEVAAEAGTNTSYHLYWLPL